MRISFHCKKPMRLMMREIKAPYGSIMETGMFP